MGYSGATYLVQEVCNSLFDALFHILPLGTQMDRVDPTPARRREELAWDAAATAAIEDAIGREPVLVRISAARRLRDLAEFEARKDGLSDVGLAHVRRADERRREPA